MKWVSLGKRILFESERGSDFAFYLGLGSWVLGPFILVSLKIRKERSYYFFLLIEKKKKKKRRELLFGP